MQTLFLKLNELLKIRSELFGIELHEEVSFYKKMMFAGTLATIAFLAFWIMASLAALLLSWDTSWRYVVLTIVVVKPFLIALALFVYCRRQLGLKPPAFEVSKSEITDDLRLLQRVLVVYRAQNNSAEKE